MYILESTERRMRTFSNLTQTQITMKGNLNSTNISHYNSPLLRAVKLEEIKEALELPSVLPGLSLGRRTGESLTPPPTPYGTPYIGPGQLDNLAKKMEKL